MARVVHSNHVAARRDAVACARTRSRPRSKPEARCNTLEPGRNKLAAHSNRPTHHKRDQPHILLPQAEIPKVSLTPQRVAA
jgi:hypothetical protein